MSNRVPGLSCGLFCDLGVSIIMGFGRRSSLAGVLLAATAATHPAPAATHARRGATPPKTAAKHAVKSKLSYQASIDDRRATEIQAALIKSGYLSGQPSGHWDSTTEAAMAKLQADNGWQTKLVPDSRALIKIGLGPSTTPKPDQTSPVATLSQP
jgi:hypothetical protein